MDRVSLAGVDPGQVKIHPLRNHLSGPLGTTGFLTHASNSLSQRLAALMARSAAISRQLLIFPKYMLLNLVITGQDASDTIERKFHHKVSQRPPAAPRWEQICPPENAVLRARFPFP
jgi:hypothetical protein